MEQKKNWIAMLLRAAAMLLVLLLLLACMVLFWHFPRYLLRQEPVEIPAGDSGTVKLMSCNLRCLTPLDLDQRSWFYRADLIMDGIENQAPGIIGFQEATVWQYDYLVRSMPDYDSVITYRDESVIAEGCPIFYHTERFSLVDKGSFWLSETPEVMSKDWGSACYRICSYVILTDKSSGEDFVVFNTHLDHVSDEARIKGIQVVLDKIAAFGGLPAVIMGDLNAQEGSQTYISATQNFRDARYAAADTMDGGTYQNWGEKENPSRIDYFMVSFEGFEILRYVVISDTYNDVYASDHFPIVLEVRLEEEE